MREGCALVAADEALHGLNVDVSVDVVVDGDVDGDGDVNLNKGL